MSEYHKIQTVYFRDPANNHKTLLEGQWSEPEFEYLKDNPWRATEKVDGTNVRVMWDGRLVRFGGKTADAQLNALLVARLADMFPAERMAATFDGPACLYGEGYGAKIQKSGGRYSASPNFILFDVKVGEWWLLDKDVLDVSEKLGCMMVPIVLVGTLVKCINKVREGYKSQIAVDADLDAEGLVMRPCVPLFNRKGERVITKIKHKDFTRSSAAHTAAESEQP